MVIAYDVSSDRRRYRAASMLLKAGIRIQKSVYECDEEDLELLLEELGGVIDVGTDVVHVFAQCEQCRRYRREIGQAPPSLEELWWVV